MRKGVGTLPILDDDVVEPSNLNRQRFYARDLFKKKAWRLAKNLACEGFTGTVIHGHALRLQDAVDQGVDLSCDVAIIGVDNNPARVFASRYFGYLWQCCQVAVLLREYPPRGCALG